MFVCFISVHIERAPDALNLVLENITSSDNGSYTCSARVGGSTVKKRFSLHVSSEY